MLPHEMAKKMKVRFKGSAVTNKVPALRVWRRVV